MVCSIYHYKVELGFKISPTPDWHWKIEQLKLWVFLKESSVLIIAVKTQNKVPVLILIYVINSNSPVYIFVRKESVKQFAAVLYLSRCPLDISIFCTNKPRPLNLHQKFWFWIIQFSFVVQNGLSHGYKPHNNSRCSWCDAFGLMLMIGEWGGYIDLCCSRKYVNWKYDHTKNSLGPKVLVSSHKKRC